MRYTKISIIASVFLLLVLPTVLADTQFKIIAPEGHRVSTIIRAQGQLTTLESNHQDVSASGEITFTSTVTPEILDIIVTLKKDGEQIKNKKFENVTSQDSYIITMIPGEELTIISQAEKLKQEAEKNAPQEITQESAPIQNVSESDTQIVDTQEETIKTTNQESEQPAQKAIPTTGFTISSLIPSGKFSYILLVVVAVGALLFIIIAARSKFNTLGSNQIDQRRIENAERRIKEVQMEIDRLKNKEDREKKMLQAREKLKTDQEELQKLQKEFY